MNAPPEKGKANRAVCEVVARALALRPSQVELVSGETSRDKVLAIDCPADDEPRLRECVATLGNWT